MPNRKSISWALWAKEVFLDRAQSIKETETEEQYIETDWANKLP